MAIAPRSSPLPTKRVSSTGGSLAGEIDLVPFLPGDNEASFVGAESTPWGADAVDAATALAEDVKVILKSPFGDVMKFMLHDRRGPRFLTTFLSHRTRLFEMDATEKHGGPGRAALRALDRRVLLWLCRLVSVEFVDLFESDCEGGDGLLECGLPRGSGRAFKVGGGTAETYWGAVLYDNFVFDIPMLMDICSVYGSGCLVGRPFEIDEGVRPQDLVGALGSRLLFLQPKYVEDVEVVVGAMADVLRRSSRALSSVLEDLCGVKEDARVFRGGECKEVPEMVQAARVLCDACVGLGCLLRLVPDLCFGVVEVGKVEEFVKKDDGIFMALVATYEHTLPLLDRSDSNRHGKRARMAMWASAGIRHAIGSILHHVFLSPLGNDVVPPPPSSSALLHLLQNESTLSTPSKLTAMQQDRCGDRSKVASDLYVFLQALENTPCPSDWGYILHPKGHVVPGHMCGGAGSLLAHVNEEFDLERSLRSLEDLHTLDSVRCASLVRLIGTVKSRSSQSLELHDPRSFSEESSSSSSPVAAGSSTPKCSAEEIEQVAEVLQISHPRARQLIQAHNSVESAIAHGLETAEAASTSASRAIAAPTSTSSVAAAPSGTRLPTLAEAARASVGRGALSDMRMDDDEKQQMRELIRLRSWDEYDDEPDDTLEGEAMLAVDRGADDDHEGKDSVDNTLNEPEPDDEENPETIPASKSAIPPIPPPLPQRERRSRGRQAEKPPQPQTQSQQPKRDPSSGSKGSRRRRGRVGGKFSGEKPSGDAPPKKTPSSSAPPPQKTSSSSSPPHPSKKPSSGGGNPKARKGTLAAAGMTERDASRKRKDKGKDRRAAADRKYRDT